MFNVSNELNDSRFIHIVWSAVRLFGKGEQSLWHVILFYDTYFTLYCIFKILVVNLNKR